MTGTIYFIENTTNRMRYFGSTTYFEQRIKLHFASLKGNRHYNKNLQSDFNKHGRSAFKCVAIDTIKKKKSLDLRNALRLGEQFQIENYRHCYNTVPAFKNKSTHSYAPVIVPAKKMNEWEYIKRHGDLHKIAIQNPQYEKSTIYIAYKNGFGNPGVILAIATYFESIREKRLEVKHKLKIALNRHKKQLAKIL